MVDLTQPANAAEFEAAGVDPVTAAGLAQQHEIMAGRGGSFDDRIALAHSVENLPPPTKPAAPATTVTPAEATAMLEAHSEAELSRQFAEVMAPPASPSDYRFPYSRTDATDEQFAADVAVKNALHAEAMPKFAVESIAKSLAEVSRTVASETPDEAQARIGSNQTRLSALWGAENFNSNIDIVDGLLEQMSARSPALRDFIARAAPMLDPLSVDLLLQVANHRAGRR